MVHAEGPIVVNSNLNGSKGSNYSDQQGASQSVIKEAPMEVGTTSRSGGQQFEIRKNSSNRNGSSESKPFHWIFQHANNFPVTDDLEGIYHLLFHYKSVGCQMLVVKNLAEKETCVKMAAATGNVILWSLLSPCFFIFVATLVIFVLSQVIEVSNRLIALYEKR